MTKYRMYRCNLCGDYLEPTDSTSKPGFGLHYLSGGACCFRRVSETERHICHQCARSVHDELRKVTPVDCDGEPRLPDVCGSGAEYGAHGKPREPDNR